MSFIEMREFTEKLRQIGYWNKISLESFKQPNFMLMADILKYFIRCYESTSPISKMEVDTVAQRVSFIKNICKFMYTRMDVRVKVGRLYESWNSSIKEASKILNHILHAINKQPHMSIESSTGYGIDDNEATVYHLMTSVTKRSEELIEARCLLKELTKSAVSLHCDLASEPSNCDERLVALSQTYNVQEVEDHMHACSINLQEELLILKGKLQELKEDEVKLMDKSERKGLELDRALRRYDLLKKIKPIYLDEFQLLEEKLSEVHDSYLSKHKQLQYLEWALKKCSSVISVHELLVPGSLEPLKALSHDGNSVDDEDEEDEVLHDDDDDDDDDDVLAIRPPLGSELLVSSCLNQQQQNFPMGHVLSGEGYINRLKRQVALMHQSQDLALLDCNIFGGKSEEEEEEDEDGDEDGGGGKSDKAKMMMMMLKMMGEEEVLRKTGGEGDGGDDDF